VYEGMIVGIHSRDNDLVVNATRTKQLTNFRVSGKEDAIKITPPIDLTLEYGVEFIEDDELVEITPKSVRLRKRHLKEHDRKRDGAGRAAQALFFCSFRLGPAHEAVAPTQAVFLMVAVTLMWSIAGVITRQLEGAQLRGDLLAQLLHRAVAAGDPAVLPGARGVRQDPPRGWALWLSGLCWSVMFTAFMVALTLTSVANVLVTMALGPLPHRLIARVFIGHRIPLRTWARDRGGRRRHRLHVRRATGRRPAGRHAGGAVRAAGRRRQLDGHAALARAWPATSTWCRPCWSAP
jgi:hypothetical protein